MRRPARQRFASENWGVNTTSCPDLALIPRTNNDLLNYGNNKNERSDIHRSKVFHDLSDHFDSALKVVKFRSKEK
jgi:hypothetical protein